MEQYELNYKLEYACIDGDLEKAKEAIQEGAEVNNIDLTERTPLHCAAGNGHLDIVKLLVENGADLYFYSENHGRAVDFAVKLGHTEIAEYLHQAMDEQDILQDELNQKLLEACRTGNFKQAKKYLRDGSGDIYAYDSWDQTPIHYAVMYENLDMVKFLVYYDAELCQRNGNGETPLDLAIDRRHTRIVKYLHKKMKEEDLYAQDMWGCGSTPLDDAVSRGHTEVVKYLKQVMKEAA